MADRYITMQGDPVVDQVPQPGQYMSASERDRLLLAQQPEQYRSTQQDYRTYLGGISDPQGPSFADLGWRDKEKALEMGAPIALKPGDLERMSSDDIEKYVKPWAERQKDPKAVNAFLTGQYRMANELQRLEGADKLSTYYGSNTPQFRQRFAQVSGQAVPEGFVPPTVPQREAVGRAEDIARYKARDKLKPPPTQAQNAYATNNAQLQKLDQAIKLAEGKDVEIPGPDGKMTTLRGDKSATGWKGVLAAVFGDTGDKMLQTIDPKGTDVRAMIGDIGSLVIHDRSGAAVTAAEFPRLRPFIPLVTDDNQTVVRKLRRFYGIVKNEMDSLASIYDEQSGYRPLGKAAEPSGGSEGKVAPAPQQGSKLTPEQRAVMIEYLRRNKGKQ